VRAAEEDDAVERHHAAPHGRLAADDHQVPTYTSLLVYYTAP
jgi:hypothetical protein